MMLAFGRDPYFDGWPDTFQLTMETRMQDSLITVLEKLPLYATVSLRHGHADLARCFRADLGQPHGSFWPQATERVRKVSPAFCFMAEVYWDREWTMQQQGFDYTYDKRLYDRLHEGHARAVREHFRADLDYQKKGALHGKSRRASRGHDILTGSS